MVNLLFVTRYSLVRTDSLKAKSDGQIQAFSDAGYNVFYFAYDNKSVYLIHDGDKTPISRVRLSNTPIFRHVFSYIYLYKSVIRALKKELIPQEGYSYIRSMPKELFHCAMLRTLSKYGYTNIVEIPTYIKNGSERPVFIIRILQKVLRVFKRINIADCYTVIGDDCCGIYNGQPAINIENGIDANGYPIRGYVNHHGINLLGVACMSDWHGFDRIIKGISQAGEKAANITLYLVGGEGDGSLARWKRLVFELGLEKNVCFTGPLFGEQLSDIINKCDIAFASLGMFRTHCFNASVLKAREYMARGIPFVYATNDPVLDTINCPYIYKISNDETPVNIEDILSFYYSLNKSNSISDEMHRYAEDYMSWSKQIAIISSFVKQL